MSSFQFGPRHVDQPLMPARLAKAGGDEMLHAEMAHVAERHRLTGWARVLLDDFEYRLVLVHYHQTK